MNKLKILSFFCILFAFLLLLSCNNEPESSDVVLDDSYYTDKYDYDNNDTFLGRAINMGNYLEAPADETYPLGEGAWTGGRLIQQSDFTNIKAIGFKSVRIPIRWSDHAAMTEPYAVDSAFMVRVKEVVDWALGEDLNVVINTHHYIEMFDSSDPTPLATHRERLKAIWDQICTIFPIDPYSEDILVFEFLNEPNDRVGYDDWNTIIAELTTVIWNDNSATQTNRKIMVGTANWGGVTGLNELDLPTACDSTNTLITVHYYEPFHFTHQGAEWVTGSDAWIGTPWRGTDEDQAPLISLLDSVTTWNSGADRGFEIFMGEFGVYTKYADADYQQAWTAFIAREAEHRVMSWGYWEYASGFGAYDPDADAWRTQLIDALIPVEDRP